MSLSLQVEPTNGEIQVQVKVFCEVAEHTPLLAHGFG